MPVTRVPVPIALTIAGSDPSGGAGLQADLKTFHQHGAYGMAVVTLITVQNTRAVSRVDVLDAGLVREQLEAVLDDVPPHALKTGALGNAAVIGAVAKVLAKVKVPVVVDPVMISKHGHALLAADAHRTLVEELLPVCSLVTPNADEAAALTGLKVTTVAEAEVAARALATRGPKAVLVKGGHLAEEREAVDVLFAEGQVTLFRAPRVVSQHTHGTGCSSSAAITALLAKGVPLVEAVGLAKEWLGRALASPPEVGRGIGPVNHLVR
ncbi:MAG: bifunctional hydroxymethylpyrimidine kinase/phosphomethylpyrimidine kinase [Myxococcaceae bacterium]